MNRIRNREYRPPINPWVPIGWITLGAIIAFAVCCAAFVALTGAGLAALLSGAS
jgi:hypothetical protein